MPPIDASNLLYEKVADAVAGHIGTGVLRAGERVPSVRRLSAQHRVSIATVVQAYTVLESRGLIEARPRSGFYVRSHWQEHAKEVRTSRPSSAPRPVSLDELRARVFQDAAAPDLLALGAATPSASLLPVARLNRTFGTVARRAGAAALDYSPPPGSEALRRQLARRALEWGCQLGPEEFIITDGAMEAVVLSLRATTRPGDLVALESPTYFGLLAAVESLGLRAVEIATHPRAGIDLEKLELALRRQKIAVVLAVPSFNNPLGSCLPPENRARLVELLSKREIPLIEDDLYGDLPFPPLGRPHAVKSFDRRGLVLLCGSVSKTLAPGLRVGWVVPGERYYERIKQLKTASTMATSTVPQLALAEFLREGGYERHLRGLRQAFADQVAHMAEAVTATFPPGVRLSRPQGGFVLWIELSHHVDALELHARARQAGVAVAPGPMFSVQGALFAHFLRLNCGAPWSPRIERGVAILGRLASDMETEAGD